MEDKILNLFAYHESLSFSQIQKALKIRSNLLSYHLSKLIKSNILAKENNSYKISSDSEYLVPYLSNKQSVLPVILVHIGNNKKAFLIQRNKRPFKNLFSLPGGRLLLGESIPQAAERILKEKSSLQISNPKVSQIIHEQVKKKNKIIHSFLLIVVKAKAQIPLQNIQKLKKQIISSDYNIITQKSSKSLKEVITKI
ncbi:MAG: NUDIX domain-containing protein [Nanoarchaeota archaeon]